MVQCNFWRREANCTVKQTGERLVNLNLQIIVSRQIKKSHLNKLEKGRKTYQRINKVNVLLYVNVRGNTEKKST